MQTVENRMEEFNLPEKACENLNFILRSMGTRAVEKVACKKRGDSWKHSIELPDLLLWQSWDSATRLESFDICRKSEIRYRKMAYLYIIVKLFKYILDL